MGINGSSPYSVNDLGILRSHSQNAVDINEVNYLSDGNSLDITYWYRDHLKSDQ
jgi:hypothetical protein